MLQKSADCIHFIIEKGSWVFFPVGFAFLHCSSNDEKCLIFLGEKGKKICDSYLRTLKSSEIGV